MADFREGQNYWINPTWKVQRNEGGIVCDFPSELQGDSELVYNVCHAKNDEEVKHIIKEYKMS